MGAASYILCISFTYVPLIIMSLNNILLFDANFKLSIDFPLWKNEASLSYISLLLTFPIALKLLYHIFI